MNVHEILPIVTAQAGLCPVPLAMVKTLEAADEYFKKTHAWKHDVHIPFTMPYQESFELPVPKGTKACAVYGVWLNGYETQHIPGDIIMPLPIAGVARHRCGLVQGWQFLNGRLEINAHCWPNPFPFPTHWHKFLEARVALTIQGRNPELPDWIDPNDIAAGALGKIFALAGQPWANGDLSIYFTDKFNEAIAEKRVEILHAGRPGSLRIQAPVFGG